MEKMNKTARFDICELSTERLLRLLHEHIRILHFLLNAMHFYTNDDSPYVLPRQIW